MKDQYLLSGLIRLHILHHAAEEPIYGLGIAEELARHGYKLGPGTLYPLLHALTKRGYLKMTARKDRNRIRKIYRATPAGKAALEAARAKVRELFGELIGRRAE